MIVNKSVMKKLQWLLCAALLCAAEFALAQVATVSYILGTAQAIPGAGAARALRKGDSLNQGETVTTAEGSSIVIRFDDGQVVALAARSRFAITTYTYNKDDPDKSSVLLSLAQGGMRVLTGLIGKRNPASVAYRAGNATIGIRGTDVMLATSDGAVAITVGEGAITFTFNGQTVSIPVGQGAMTNADGTIQSAPAAQIVALIQALGTPAAMAIAAALQSVSAPDIQSAVTQAVREGAAPPGSKQLSSPPSTPSASGTTGSSGSGGAGGGSPSGR